MDTIQIKAKIKHLLLKASGKYGYMKKTVKCKQAWYGNLYGGFYLNPDLLTEKSIVYSFGIGEDISFDTAIIEQHQCNVFGFDPTPKSIQWIKKQKTPEKFHFFEFGISAKTGFLDFYLLKNTEWVSGSLVAQDNVDLTNKLSVPVKSLQDIATELGHTHIDVLKMDIEDAEYDVIDNILASKISITQLLIEFHGRFYENGTEKTQRAIRQLSEKGYEIFAVADSFEEVSFIHKSALK